MKIKTLFNTVLKRTSQDSTNLKPDELYPVSSSTVLEVNWVKEVENNHILFELQEAYNGFYNWYAYSPTVKILDGKAEGDKAPSSRLMISPHFSLEEAIASQTAERLGINNQPTQTIIKRLSAVANAVLEPARKELGPLRVSSGYRCPRLNAAIGGSRTSEHMGGYAFDIVPYNASVLDLLRYVAKHHRHQCSQIISEFGTEQYPSWAHIACGPRRQGQLLRIDGRGSRVVSRF